MSHAQPWPELSWTVSPQRLQWLIDRTKQMGEKARAFELALEQAAEAGEAALSRVADELELWEGLSANVWMYVGLGEAKQVAAEDVPSHAEELEKVWNLLREQREAILSKLGDGAANVLAREAAAKIEYAQLVERAGELPSFGPEVDALGVALPQHLFEEEVARPITGDEFRQRHAAESKALPEPADFKSLLGMLPPPWVQAVFETIGLEIPSELIDGDEEVELTANSRTTLQKRVLIERMGPELLEQIVFALEDADRALLAELVNAEGGALRYSDATRSYGRDDADGFFWLDRPPSGTVAHLRRVGLAFVGMREGKQLLVVPADLREPIRALLA